MQIRNMIQEDVHAYMEMAEIFYQGDAALEPVDPAHYTKTFQTILKQTPYVRGVMLEVDGTSIGYALLGFLWSCEKGSMMVFIDELFIQEAYRRKQYATAFFTWIETTYPLGEYHYRLEVNPKNPRAQALYKRLGYQILPYTQMVK